MVEIQISVDLGLDFLLGEILRYTFSASITLIGANYIIHLGRKIIACRWIVVDVNLIS